MRSAPTLEQLPAPVRARLSAARSELIYHPYATATWRIERDGEVCYLKAGWADAHPSLGAERDRIEWLAARAVAVPEIVDAGCESRVEWLVTRALTGMPATSSEHLRDPRRLTVALAEGLRAFHDIDPAGCPFDNRPSAAVAHVRARVSAGLVDPQDLHDEHAGLTPPRALARLERLAPTTVEDVVVTHGDYCPPNVFVHAGRVVGYLDLGEVGLAERWRDLAVATWSLGWNLGPGYEDLFLDAYGAEWDIPRRDFYRLLFDLES